jgi:hypothetical protein
MPRGLASISDRRDPEFETSQNRKVVKMVSSLREKIITLLYHLRKELLLWTTKTTSWKQTLQIFGQFSARKNSLYLFYFYSLWASALNVFFKNKVECILKKKFFFKLDRHVRKNSLYC